MGEGNGFMLPLPSGGGNSLSSQVRLGHRGHTVYNLQRVLYTVHQLLFRGI
jgi:hypothetical protein